MDRFLKAGLGKAYAEREGRTGRVEAADGVLDDVVKRIKRRGITHPYVKNFVLARCNPLSRARKSLPTFEQTFEKLTAALEKFDPERIRLEDITRAAVAVAS